jgi:hypothetical protein
MMLPESFLATLAASCCPEWRHNTVLGGAISLHHVAELSVFSRMQIRTNLDCTGVTPNSNRFASKVGDIDIGDHPHIRDGSLREQGPMRAVASNIFQHPSELFRLSGKCCPFVKHGIDAPPEGSNTPALHAAHFGSERPALVQII